MELSRGFGCNAVLLERGELGCKSHGGAGMDGGRITVYRITVKKGSVKSKLLFAEYFFAG